MRAGQTLVARDGYEVALFPMEYLNMSQDEGGDYSHQGTYNIDLLGWGSHGRVYNCPMYAPCTCKLVYKLGSGSGGNARFFQSVNQVHTPSGLMYLQFYFGHDPSPPINTIGQVVNQGDLIYHTGTEGYVTGDHCHTCMGFGQWISWSASIHENRNPAGSFDYENRMHYWEAVYVNDTTIISGYLHHWVTWDEPPVPLITVNKSNFPWVLYANKLRS